MKTQTQAFSDACYEQNTTAELQPTPGLADAYDCAEWGITEAEWHQAKAAALTDRLRDAAAWEAVTA